MARISGYTTNARPGPVMDNRYQNAHTTNARSGHLWVNYKLQSRPSNGQDRRFQNAHIPIGRLGHFDLWVNSKHQSRYCDGQEILDTYFKLAVQVRWKGDIRMHTLQTPVQTVVMNRPLG